jgi:uncharacterized protein (DUF427 family)
MKSSKTRESVWDYPRPALCERFQGSLRIIQNERVLAQTNQAYRSLETSHPPTYYFPPEDIDMSLLVANGQRSFCEWKGVAHYFDLRLPQGTIQNAAWTYQQPNAPFSSIRGYLSFYASRVDACYVDDERVEAQQGDFYGGWITTNLVGPFKGPPGTSGW